MRFNSRSKSASLRVTAVSLSSSDSRNDEEEDSSAVLTLRCLGEAMSLSATAAARLWLILARLLLVVDPRPPD